MFVKTSGSTAQHKMWQKFRPSFKLGQNSLLIPTEKSLQEGQRQEIDVSSELFLAACEMKIN